MTLINNNVGINTQNLNNNSLSNPIMKQNNNDVNIFRKNSDEVYF